MRPSALPRPAGLAGILGSAVTAITAATAVTVAVVASRRAALRRHAALLDGRAGLGADGVLAGAGTIDLRQDDGGDRAALILHGFGDTPQSVAPLATHLHVAGWTVRAPLLPGHGRTLREFGRSSAADWLECAAEEMVALQDTHRRVVLMGQSMGGALASILAAASPPPALVLLAPYLDMPPRVRRLARLSRIWSIPLPYVDSGGEESILDETERGLSLGYGAVNGRVLRQLLNLVDRARVVYPRVHSPLLIAQSRRDHRIAQEVTLDGFERFGSARKRLVWLDEGGHVLAVDRGREQLFDLIETWLDEVVPPL